jgi:hypothetical protein
MNIYPSVFVASELNSSKLVPVCWCPLTVDMSSLIIVTFRHSAVDNHENEIAERHCKVDSIDFLAM